MEQLIFFAVLIVFSVLESIAKARKRKGGGPLPELPEPEPEQWPPRRPRAEGPRPSVPPSYDDEATRGPRARREEARSLEAETSYDQIAAAEAERRRRASSESMIPADLWEEISGRTRGAEGRSSPPRPRAPVPPTQRPRKAPKAKKPAAQPPTRPQPSTPPTRAPWIPPRTVDRGPEHPVHLAHAGFGTDPSERAAAQAREAPRPLEKPAHADALAVRERLRSRSVSALRQAVILQEILGPPAALRPDRFEK